MYIIYEGVKPSYYLYTGDWSNGMIGVSKTFGGSSILSSPAHEKPQSLELTGLSGFYILKEKGGIDYVHVL